jgi:translation initiation factor 5B
MKIEAHSSEQQSRLFGRHFDHTDPLVSLISRESIDALKSHFRVRELAPEYDLK